MKYLTGIIMIICALIIAVSAFSKKAEFKLTVKDAGLANGIVTSTTSDKVILRGKSQIVYSAAVRYEADGREYTASVPISNSAAPKKIVIYYDKNSPETIYTPPTGTKDAFILSAILALSGVAVLVWRR